MVDRAIVSSEAPDVIARRGDVEDLESGDCLECSLKLIGETWVEVGIVVGGDGDGVGGVVGTPDFLALVVREACCEKSISLALELKQGDEDSSNHGFFLVEVVFLGHLWVGGLVLVARRGRNWGLGVHRAQ